jgi:hypothetical protein
VIFYNNQTLNRNYLCDQYFHWWIDFLCSCAFLRFNRVMKAIFCENDYNGTMQRISIIKDAVKPFTNISYYCHRKYGCCTINICLAFCYFATHILIFCHVLLQLILQIQVFELQNKSIKFDSKVIFVKFVICMDSFFYVWKFKNIYSCVANFWTGLIKSHGSFLITLIFFILDRLYWCKTTQEMKTMLRKNNFTT